MSQLRLDPLRGYCVVVSEDRADRPDEFLPSPLQRRPIRCPFCGGHEDATPIALAEYPHPSAGSWITRVVPNKFPAFSSNAAPVKPTERTEFPCHPGVGVHEVIIESPRHVASFTSLTKQEACSAVGAYRDRMEALEEAPHVQYGLLFKNTGGDAGASIEHTHSQLIGMPIVPPDVRAELALCQRHHELSGGFLLEAITAAEQEEQARLVAESDHFVAFCPFASRFPYQICVAPRQPAERFTTASESQLADLADFLQQLIGKLEQATSGAAYNLLIHSAPCGAEHHPGFCWRVELFPRITRQAGFEWGAGAFINATPPEAAAEVLRGSSGSS